MSIIGELEEYAVSNNLVGQELKSINLGSQFYDETHLPETEVKQYLYKLQKQDWQKSIGQPDGQETEEFNSINVSILFMTLLQI